MSILGIDQVNAMIPIITALFLFIIIEVISDVFLTDDSALLFLILGWIGPSSRSSAQRQRDLASEHGQRMQQPVARHSWGSPGRTSRGRCCCDPNPPQRQLPLPTAAAAVPAKPVQMDRGGTGTGEELICLNNAYSGLCAGRN